MTATNEDVRILPVRREKFRIHAEVTPGPGTPIVMMHGFPDNVHLYDRLLPHLAGHRPLVRFDFLGWGASDKPDDYPYTAVNQAGDLAVVADAVAAEFGTDRMVLIAHDASGPPAIDWALANPHRVATLVLLNTYYHWTPRLRRPPAIALYSTPVVRAGARALVRRYPDLDRRLYAWQVGRFIIDPTLRESVVPALYRDFGPARPAFWRLNDDLLPTVWSRRRRLPELKSFTPTVRVIFGRRDRYLNPAVAIDLASRFPNSEVHLLMRGGHYIQIDQPAQVADLILRSPSS